MCVSEQKAAGAMKDPGPAAGWTTREVGLQRRSVGTHVHSQKMNGQE